MRAAAKPVVLLSLGLSVAACNNSPQDAPVNNATVTDVETLPPDESVETPSDEIMNGSNETTDTNASEY